MKKVHVSMGRIAALMLAAGLIGYAPAAIGQESDNDQPQAQEQQQEVQDQATEAAEADSDSTTADGTQSGTAADSAADTTAAGDAVSDDQPQSDAQSATPAPPARESLEQTEAQAESRQRGQANARLRQDQSAARANRQNQPRGAQQAERPGANASLDDQRNIRSEQRIEAQRGQNRQRSAQFDGSLDQDRVPSEQDRARLEQNQQFEQTQQFEAGDQDLRTQDERFRSEAALDSRSEFRSRLDAQGPMRGRMQIRSAADLGLQLQEAERGLTIAQIEQNSFLADSGLRQGDLLIAVDGRPVRSQAQFVRWFTVVDPGTRVPVVVLRDGRREVVYVTVNYYDSANEFGVRSYNDATAYLGVSFDDRYQNVALVDEVYAGTPAEQAGLQPGDMIQAINGRRIQGPAHVSHVIGQMQPGEQIEIAFSRRVSDRTVATLGARPEPRQAAYDLDVPPEYPRETYFYRGDRVQPRGYIDDGYGAYQRGLDVDNAYQGTFDQQFRGGAAIGQEGFDVDSRLNGRPSEDRGLFRGGIRGDLDVDAQQDRGLLRPLRGRR